MRKQLSRRQQFACWILIGMVRPIAMAQTKVDLRTQGKSFDLSAAGETRTFQIGATLPANCGVGASFIKTGQPAATLYICTITDTWTQITPGTVPTVTGSGGGSLAGTRLSSASADSLAAADNGVNVVYTGTGPVALAIPQANGSPGLASGWTAFVLNATTAGNLTLTPNTSLIDNATSVIVPPLQGLSVWSDGTNFHTNGTVIRAGSGVVLSNRQLAADTAVMLAVADFQTAAAVNCFSGGGVATAYSCTTGTIFSAYSNGMRLNWQNDVACSGAPTLAVNALPAVPLRKPGGSPVGAGDCDTAGKNLTLAYNTVLAGGPYWEIVGGGAAGATAASAASPAYTLPSAVVQTNQSNVYTTGTQDYSSAQHTLPAATGLLAARPTTCKLGETYFVSDATAGQNLNFCTATNTWTQQLGSASGASGVSVTAAPPYLQIGSGFYLPFGFSATLPPTTGWTAVNFSGSGFITSGLGGAVAIDSVSYSVHAGSAAGQYRPMGATSTLIAVVSGQQALTGQVQGCGVGVLQSSTGKAFVLQNIFYGATNLTEEDSYFNGLDNAAFFNGQTGVGGFPMVFLRLQLIGTDLVTAISSNGLAWTTLLTRPLSGYGMASSFDQWLFTAAGQSSSPTRCSLLSWSVQ